MSDAFVSFFGAAEIAAAVLVSVAAFSIALFFPYFTNFVNIFFEKKRHSNIIPLEVISFAEGTHAVYRLVVRNDSDYQACGVEMDVVELIDNGNPRSFLPLPLRWTNRRRMQRDILPHQTVYVDLLDIGQPGRFVVLATPDLDNTRAMPVLPAGTSRLILQYFVEDGQTAMISLEVDWSGQEMRDPDNMPVVRFSE